MTTSCDASSQGKTGIVGEANSTVGIPFQVKAPPTKQSTIFTTGNAAAAASFTSEAIDNSFTTGKAAPAGRRANGGAFVSLGRAGGGGSGRGDGHVLCVIRNKFVEL